MSATERSVQSLSSIDPNAATDSSIFILASIRNEMRQHVTVSQPVRWIYTQVDVSELTVLPPSHPIKTKNDLRVTKYSQVVFYEWDSQGA